MDGLEGLVSTEAMVKRQMQVLKDGNEELYAKAQNLIDDYYRE